MTSSLPEATFSTSGSDADCFIDFWCQKSRKVTEKHSIWAPFRLKKEVKKRVEKLCRFWMAFGMISAMAMRRLAECAGLL